MDLTCFHLVLAIERKRAEWLKRAAEETGRSLEELIESATEEAALDYAKKKGWI